MPGRHQHLPSHFFKCVVLVLNVCLHECTPRFLWAVRTLLARVTKAIPTKNSFPVPPRNFGAYRYLSLRGRWIGVFRFWAESIVEGLSGLSPYIEDAPRFLVNTPITTPPYFRVSSFLLFLAAASPNTPCTPRMLVYPSSSETRHRSRKYVRSGRQTRRARLQIPWPYGRRCGGSR